MIRTRRPFLLGVIAALLATAAPLAPAAATEVEENEALVMRIVFEDCLGYIRAGTTPFAGLDTRPASEEALKAVHRTMRAHGTTVQLLAPRYVAAWGEAPDARFCVVHTVYGENGPPGDGKLGVRPEGFIARVTERAAKAGLTHAETSDVFSPVHSTRWAEPETGFEAGPKRPIALSLMPTAANADKSLLDAGLIVMGGPTLGKP
ncbi:hypothetical protein GCM10007301_44700 [Azorhizobium oxalatiphilum]|uniref:Uncharacterized protein n=1 Tax=Azorhizobium oxalatiphilum TaxID=980631 RepID=A0A917CBA3_9HYPH|nr:hypothetical protein [Azorhizobium oxalatiphilum]GGF79692.1 hypothetical protein GCM10007301_44700 [Azorhizobium oxalatiphilum]